MSQLIANRYLPLDASLEALAAGRALRVRDTLRGDDLELRVVAGPEVAHEHWLFRLRVGALARMRHPGLQALFEPGQLPDGSLFVTGSPRRGRPIQALLPLPPEHVPGVFLGLCQAIRALHGRGLAHGQLSPELVTLADDFTPQLGHGLGLGLSARPEEDLAQLGKLFFYMLTGKQPAPGQTLPSQVHSNVPAHQDALVQRLLTGGCADIDEVFLLLPIQVGESAILPLSEAPLAGRDAELAKLAQAWSQVSQAGQGRLVAVTGASGLGKSRLLDEAALGYRLGGTMVLAGRAGDSPYRSWTEILKQALPAARKHCPEAFAAAAPALSALLGDLGVEAAPALEPRQEKLRLQAAIGDLLGALATRGLVLVLEDWDQADDLSRETLTYLARLRGDRPLLLLLAGAEASVPADDTLDLAPLPAEALGRIGKDVLGGRPLAARTLETLSTLSAGNPQLLLELLGHLAQAGELRLTEQGWAVANDLAARPHGLEDLYRARLARLEPRTLDAARLAAVVGLEGETALLKALWPHDEAELAPALDSLRVQGLLEVGADSFRFVQPLWLKLLEAGSSPTDWQTWHDRAAEALAHLAEAGRAPADAVLRQATHALAGSNALRAVAAALDAGQYQMRFNAPAASRRYLEQGFALWQREGGANGPLPALELPYLRLLGDALRAGGEYAPAVAYYGRACELALASQAHEAAAHMLTSAGKCMQMSNQYAEADSYYQQALDLYANLQVPSGKLRALNSRARTFLVVGNRAQSEALYMQALQEAEAASETVAQAEALGTLGLMIVSNEPGRIKEGIQFLERSIALRQAIGDKIGLNDSYSLLGNAYLTLGQYTAAKSAFNRNQRLCYECGLADEEIFALINLSIVALEMGELTRGRDLALAANERSRQSGSRFCLALALALEGLALAYLGELTTVMPLIDEAVDIAQAMKNKYLEINVRVWQTEALLIFGRLTEAVEVAHTATELMEELSYREFEPGLLVLKAEVHGRLAEREEAHAQLNRAQELARENQNAGMLARVLKTLSWLHLHDKNLLQARDYARQALEVAQAVGATYVAGEAHWLLGEVDLAANQPEQATRELLLALEAGELTSSPHLQSLALFCLARASDDELRTREYMFQARDLLRAQLAQLDELDREDYLALAERWRLERGELVFAEKARSQRGQSDMSPEGRLYFERLQHFAEFSAHLHAQVSEGPWNISTCLPSLLELMEAQRVRVLVQAGDVFHEASGARGGEDATTVGADRQVLETLLGTTETFYQPFVSEDPRFAGLYPDLPASLLAVPFEQGVVLAVRLGSTFTPQEAAILKLVGQQLQVASATLGRRLVK